MRFTNTKLGTGLLKILRFILGIVIHFLFACHTGNSLSRSQCYSKSLLPDLVTNILFWVWFWFKFIYLCSTLYACLVQCCQYSAAVLPLHDREIVWH